MHTRIGMNELNEQEDRPMIAPAHDECAWRILFFSDIIYSGHYLESLALCCKKLSLSLETQIVHVMCLP